MKEEFILAPGHLNLESLRSLMHRKHTLSLDKNCLVTIQKSFQVVQGIVEEGRTVYGINTGFGLLAHETIPAEQLAKLQRNLILSHACGTGDLLSDEMVALILLLKINTLAQGYSGVGQGLIGALIGLYNSEVYPCIPSKGSVGASGDLAPLAHLSLPLLGEGNVRYQGKIISAKEGLLIAGLTPMDLYPKEGLALVNGLQVSAALCIDAYLKCQTLFHTAIHAGSLSLDAASGSDVPFDSRIQKVRGNRGQDDVAQMFRHLLKGSEIREYHRACKRVQDPYSLRCQPQIMGAVLQQMRFVQETLGTEINAVSDNPLVFPDGEVLSGGNFHGELLAMAADNLALAIAEIGASAERRIALLMDRHFSGLPSFLIKESGLNSGFMIAHVTAAACASENKALAHPYCVDSISTSANQEDHVSMATSAALRLQFMLDNTASILAIELLCACQGLEFHAPRHTSKPLQEIYQAVRLKVAAFTEDRYMAPDLGIIKEDLVKGRFAGDLHHD